MANGKITSQSDYHRQHDRIIVARQIAIARAKAPVLQAIEDLGGQVSYDGLITHFIVATLPASAVSQLAGRADVVRIELNTAEEHEVNGIHIILSKGIRSSNILMPGLTGTMKELTSISPSLRWNPAGLTTSTWGISKETRAQPPGFAVYSTVIVAGVVYRLLVD